MLVFHPFARRQIMHRAVLLLAGVLSVVALGSDSPKDYDDKTETTGIEGTWRLTGVEIYGKKKELAFQVVITLRGGTLTYDYTHGIVRGSYHVDRAGKPLHLDWMPSNGSYKGETLEFIYQIDGDILRIAFLLNGNDVQRPLRFSDDDVIIGIFNRAK
jgi:uncharacterized protein (TIGR03067 family)